MAADREVKRFINLAGIASRLAVSKQTVRRLIKSGRLKADRLNGRLLVSVQSYSAFVDEFSSDVDCVREPPISFLVRHSANREDWREFHALMRAGKLRCVAIEVNQERGYAQALIETTPRIINELRAKNFDTTAAFKAVYTTKKGDQFAVMSAGGPVCPVSELDPRIVLALEIWF